MIDLDADDWRDNRASEKQKERLNKDEFTFSPDITSGEASDLIGSKLEPDNEEKEILKYFKVKTTAEMSQTDARKIIRSLFSDPDNLALWENNEDAFWEREDWIEFFFDELNNIDTLEFYEYKEVNRELFMQVVDEFESKGIKGTMISDDMNAFIDRMLEISPQLRNTK